MDDSNEESDEPRIFRVQEVTTPFWRFDQASLEFEPRPDRMTSRVVIELGVGVSPFIRITGSQFGRRLPILIGMR